MPNNKQEPTRLELYKAGKLDERRLERAHHEPLLEENIIEEEEQQGFRLRPTAIAIGLMVIVLLILTVAGL